jgi:hypothetical protein
MAAVTKAISNKPGLADGCAPLDRIARYKDPDDLRGFSANKTMIAGPGLGHFFNLHLSVSPYAFVDTDSRCFFNPGDKILFYEDDPPRHLFERDLPTHDLVSHGSRSAFQKIGCFVKSPDNHFNLTKKADLSHLR